MSGVCVHCACFFFALLPLAASASTAYTVVDLGTLGGDKAYAYAINDVCQVVGNYHTGYVHNGVPSHAFIWHSGSYIDLGPLAGVYNSGPQILGLSDTGHVAGYAPVTMAFLWNGATHISLGSLGANRWSFAYDVNSSDWVVGWSDSVHGQRAVLWRDATVIDLGLCGDPGLTTNPTSSAYGINDAGWVVGTSSTDSVHAFLWRDGTMTDLGGGCAYAVNNSGQVAGGQGGGTGHAFIWQNGVRSDIGTLGGDSSCAYGLNDSGAVVGVSFLPGGAQRGFVWRNGLMTELCTLGGSYSCAYGINTQGWICGTATTANNVSHAVLWLPVPEPSAFVALLCGIGGVLGASSRRRPSAGGLGVEWAAAAVGQPGPQAACRRNCAGAARRRGLAVGGTGIPDRICGNCDR